MKSRRSAGVEKMYKTAGVGAGVGNACEEEMSHTSRWNKCGADEVKVSDWRK